MGYKFNPFTGTLDVVVEDGFLPWQTIPADSVVTIAENRQMVVFGGAVIEGTLEIEGSFILE